MNRQELLGRPPDTQALTVQKVKLWESGLLTLSPDEIVSARELQQKIVDMMIEQSVDIVLQDTLVQAIDEIAERNQLLQQSTQPAPVAA